MTNQRQDNIKAFWLAEAQGFIRLTNSRCNPPYIFLLKSKVAKQYSGFKLILNDLKNVEEIIQNLKSRRYDGNSSIIKQSFSFYAVVTYGITTKLWTLF